MSSKPGAGNARHRIIGKDEIDLLCRAQHVERDCGRCRLDRRVAKILDHRSGARQDRRVVIDKEHPHRRGLDGLGVRSFLFGRPNH